MSKRLRILVGTGTFPKLSETFVLGPIGELLKQGHDVQIAALYKGDEPHTHPEYERFELGARTTFLPAPPKSWLGRRLAPLRAIPKLGEFDAVYVHFGHVAEKFRIWRQEGVFSGPLYPVFHAFDLTVHLGKTGDREYERLFEQSELLLPISHLWAQRLKDLGAPEEKISVRRMGVSVERFPFRSQRTPDGPRQFISVARLVEKKGLSDALNALARIKPQLEMAFTYHIVGDGPLRGALTQQARELGLEGNVIFHGWQPSGQVSRLLQASDLYLLPSRVASNGDMEGLPIVLMEAMALGLLVVATEHSAVPEIVREGQTGFLAPEGAPGAFAEALLRATRRPSVALAALRTAARAEVEMHFNQTRLTQELAELFAERANARTSS